MADSNSVKLLALVRRKAGLTRHEFFDYHYQVHGTKSQAPTSETTPWIYHQTHFFDGVFPTIVGGALNANYNFAFSDDMTELIFKDWSHLQTVMTSQYVKDVVGPDGLQFNDYSAANAMLASPGTTILGQPGPQDSAVTADYFVAAIGAPESGFDVAQKLGPLLTRMIEEEGSGDIYRVDVTWKLPDEHGILKYFGIRDPLMPDYTVILKMYLKTASGATCTSVRKIQKQFEASTSEVIKSADSIVVFGKRAVIFDQSRNIVFNSSRQPVLDIVL